MRKITVNGEEVEYFHVQNNPDGSMEVVFNRKFDVMSAHMSEIMKRIRDAGYECQVFKDLEHGFVEFWLRSLNDAPGVLACLNIPIDCYEVVDEELCVVCVYVSELVRCGDVGELVGCKSC